MSSFLEKHKRQPKLFIDLPSKGIFYDDTVIQDQQYTQLPVFGMNTMDEIMLKTPDALFSGESTAKIMQSCIPLIKDPWRIIGFDLDYILLSIRIATYGNAMPVTTTCPKCNTETTSEVQLQKMLETIESGKTNNSVTINNLTFHLRPLTYKETTDFSQKHFRMQKQLNQIELMDATEDQKEQTRQNLLNELSEINIDLSIAHIMNITDGTEEETSIEAIRAFVSDNDADVFKKIREGIDEMNSDWNKDVLEIACSEEECDNVYKSQLNVDYSSFFGTRSLRSRNLIS
tara:strand:- start:957 stop:1820 length:864 start_codon:yes stop_codon:yes gene_type:complete